MRRRWYARWTQWLLLWVVLVYALASIALVVIQVRSASLTSTTCPGTGCVVVQVGTSGTIGVQLTGTFVATTQFEKTNDATNWVSWSVTVNGGTTTVTSATATGYWTGSVAGATAVRVRASAYTSGTVVVTLNSSPASLASGGAGGPVDATYLTQTPNATLTNEQALSTLATGLMNVTTTTGVVTSFAPTDDNVLVGNGTVWALKALADCQGAGKAVTYTAASNTFGCNTITGAAPAGSGSELQVRASASTLAAVTNSSFGNVLGVPTLAVPVATDLNTEQLVATATLGNLSASAVTQAGTPGAQTVTYVLVGNTPLGYHTAAGADSTTSTANATLDGTNYNVIADPALAGVVSYDIYRTVGGPSQGLIAAAVTSFPFHDTGIAGGAEDPTTVENTTGHIYAGNIVDITAPNVSPGNYTLATSGLVMRDSGGNEIWRIWGTDPNTSNYNSINLYAGFHAGDAQPTDNTSAGYGNIGIGNIALASNTTGTDNVAIGDRAMSPNTSGYYNIAIGAEALDTNITGAYNTALGAYALTFTEADENSVVGYSALYYNTTGSTNTAIGESAGNTSGNGSANERSIADTRMLFAGVNAARNASGNLTNGIALGADATVTMSNQAVIGNDSLTDIYGGSSSGTATAHAAFHGTNFLVGSTSIVPLAGTTGSIGGGLLAGAGSCATGTASVPGASPGMPVAASTSDGSAISGLATVYASVTASNTVTIQLCAIAAVTPAAKTWNVRVIQ